MTTVRPSPDKLNYMELEITCYTCHEIFIVFFDITDGSYTEVVDCEVCCRPNNISLDFKQNKIVRLDISDGNE